MSWRVRPTRDASLGVLIGGLGVLVVAGVLAGVGATDAAGTLAAVAVGIVVAGAAFNIWTVRRDAPSEPEG